MQAYPSTQIDISRKWLRWFTQVTKFNNPSFYKPIGPSLKTFFAVEKKNCTMLGEPENVGIILTRVWNACKAQEVKESRPRASLNQEPVSET